MRAADAGRESGTGVDAHGTVVAGRQERQICRVGERLPRGGCRQRARDSAAPVLGDDTDADDLGHAE